jgi:[ribosomal protein S5]-alanine N-acetyltransferase
MPFFEPVILDTARLTLRPLREDDVDSLFAMYSDAEFMRYWSFAPMTHIEQAQEYLSRLIEGSASGKQLLCAIELREAKKLIGTCTLFSVYEPSLRAEIGFGISREFWRQGYAREAVDALIAHGFSKHGLRRLEADIDPRNSGSARVLERAGFVREGLLRERWVINGEVSDTAFYGLLRKDR